MRVLITGATGFLGRYVVAALRQRGHAVRAIVRPGTSIDGLGWGDDIEVVRADLCAADHATLAAAFDHVDALVHLAASMTGDPQTQIDSTVKGTENVLHAMAEAAAARIVHISSFSVYDWRKVGRTLTEQAPLEDADVEQRDAYVVAKLRQEQAVRRFADEHDRTLTVLRPGAVWGDRNFYLPDVGQPVGPLHLVIAPRAVMKLTYVENCADVIARAVDDDRAAGQTFNITDDHVVTTWRYTGDMLARSGVGGVRVPVPYWAASLVTKLASGIARPVGIAGKLPSILQPRRFEARFKPVRCDISHLRRTLDWQPSLSYEQALERCYAAGPSAEPTAEPVTQGEQPR